MPTSLTAAVDGAALPPVTGEGVALGIGVLAGGYVLGRLLGWVLGRLLLWRGRSPSASAMFAALARWLLVVVAFAAAVTIAFPSVRPVNALGGIGVLSIAAGIAFQTVLGNMFAGIVILARDTFRVDDQVAIRDVAGTVTGVSLTSTTVRTFDGRLVHVPNAVVHSEVVTVQTGFETVRSTVVVDLDDAADLDEAVRVAEAAMRALPGVLDEPPPQALLQEVGTATVRMDLRFWSGARQMETRIAQHEVIRAVLRELGAAGLKTGSDVVTVAATPDLLAALAPAATSPDAPGSAPSPSTGPRPSRPG